MQGISSWLGSITTGKLGNTLASLKERKPAHLLGISGQSERASQYPYDMLWLMFLDCCLHVKNKAPKREASTLSSQWGDVQCGGTIDLCLLSYKFHFSNLCIKGNAINQLLFISFQHYLVIAIFKDLPNSEGLEK